MARFLTYQLIELTRNNPSGKSRDGSSAALKAKLHSPGRNDNKSLIFPDATTAPAPAPITYKSLVGNSLLFKTAVRHAIYAREHAKNAPGSSHTGPPGQPVEASARRETASEAPVRAGPLCRASWMMTISVREALQDRKCAQDRCKKSPE
jgi:hypothetical protein